MARNTIDLTDIGKRIQRARKESGMSQLALAIQCDTSLPYISDIERGKKCISIDILVRIATALNISADQLLRLSCPASNYDHSEEAARILSDCTAEEAKLLLSLMESNKAAIRQAAK